MDDCSKGTPLRSSARKRRSTSEYLDSQGFVDNSRQKKKNQTTVLKSSSTRKKSSGTYNCLGCGKIFSNNMPKKEFVQFHAIRNPQCKKALVQCFVCGEYFYNEQALNSHTRLSEKCNKKMHSKQTQMNYSTSGVLISDIKPSSAGTKESTTDFKNPTLVQQLTFQKDFHARLASVIKSYSQSKVFKQMQNTHLNFERKVTENSNASLEKDRSATTGESIQVTTFATESDNISVSSNDTSSNEVSFIDNDAMSSANNNSNVTQSNESNHGQVGSTTNNDVIDLTSNINNDTRDVVGNTSITVEDPDNTICINDVDQLLKMHKKKEKEEPFVSSDRMYQDSLELINLLMSAGLSMSWYDKFMKWKHGSDSNCTNKFMSRDKVEKSALSRVYGPTVGELMKPVTTLIKLPSCRYTNVVSYPIDGIIYDLLSDVDLMQHQNLIFTDGDEANPFSINVARNSLDDFNTSAYYIKTSEKYDVNNENTLSTPLIVYMDEANLDSYSKLTLHPVCVSLMIFNRSTRNKERAWRTLGYMPNLDAMPGSKELDPALKLSDFHFVLKHLLSGIEKLQSCGGKKWIFKFSRYPGKEYKRHCKFPLGLWIGDGKGNDTVCAKYQCRTNTTYLCRDCDIKLVESDNPNAICKFRKFNDLLSLNKDQLNVLGFHKVYCDHALKDMDFGCNPYGINGCTPPDNCHQLKKGVIERLPNIFVARLSKSQGKKMDTHGAVICSNMRRQSDRCFPPIHPFVNGITEVSKLTSDENVGRLFAVFLVLLTREFEVLCVGKPGRKPNKETQATIISQDEYNRWIVVFEDTLLLYRWAILESHPKSVTLGGRNSLIAERIKQYMTVFLGTAQRNEGEGMRLMKFHQLTHFWWVIRMYGSLLNVDTARNESFHKKKKSIAGKTQQRFNSLDSQTAFHEFSYNLLIRAMILADIRIGEKFECNFDNKKQNDNSQNNEQENQTNFGSPFMLTFHYEENRKCVSGKWLSKSLKKKDFKFPTTILQSFYDKFKNYNHGTAGQRIKTIQGFTEYRPPANRDQIFRACPTFQNSSHWYDWGLIRWEEEGLLPAQLLLFVDFSTITFVEYNVVDDDDAPHPVVNFDKAVLIHSTVSGEHLSQREPANVLLQQRTGGRRRAQPNNAVQGPVTRIAKFSRMEDTFQIVDVSTIEEPCYVVTDLCREGTTIEEPGSALHVFYFLPMKVWSNFFIDYSSDALLAEASNRDDPDISENDVVYPFEG